MSSIVCNVVIVYWLRVHPSIELQFRDRETYSSVLSPQYFMTLKPHRFRTISKRAGNVASVHGPRDDVYVLSWI